MNRKKKIKTILTKKLKKTQKREAPKNASKPRYISKAERAELESSTAPEPQQARNAADAGE